MSLIDSLREAAGAVPPSHVPTAGELAPIVGALLCKLEHGDDFLDAAAVEDQGERTAAIDAVLAPDGDRPQPTPPSSSATAELEAENLALRQQLAAAQGAAQRTTAETVPAPEGGE